MKSKINYASYVKIIMQMAFCYNFLIFLKKIDFFRYLRAFKQKNDLQKQNYYSRFSIVYITHLISTSRIKK